MLTGWLSLDVLTNSSVTITEELTTVIGLRRSRGYISSESLLVWCKRRPGQLSYQPITCYILLYQQNASACSRYVV